MLPFNPGADTQMGMTLFIVDVSINGAPTGHTVLGETATVVGVGPQGELLTDDRAASAVALFAARDGDFWARSATTENPAWIGGERLPTVWARIAGTWVIQAGHAVVTIRRLDRTADGPRRIGTPMPMPTPIEAPTQAPSPAPGVTAAPRASMPPVGPIGPTADTIDRDDPPTIPGDVSMLEVLLREGGAPPATSRMSTPAPTPASNLDVTRVEAMDPGPATRAQPTGTSAENAPRSLAGRSITRQGAKPVKSPAIRRTASIAAPAPAPASARPVRTSAPPPAPASPAAVPAMTALRAPRPLEFQLDASDLDLTRVPRPSAAPAPARPSFAPPAPAPIDGPLDARDATRMLAPVQAIQPAPRPLTPAAGMPAADAAPPSCGATRAFTPAAMQQMQQAIAARQQPAIPAMQPMQPMQGGAPGNAPVNPRAFASSGVNDVMLETPPAQAAPVSEEPPGYSRSAGPATVRVPAKKQGIPRWALLATLFVPALLAFGYSRRIQASREAATREAIVAANAKPAATAPATAAPVATTAPTSAPSAPHHASAFGVPSTTGPSGRRAAGARTETGGATAEAAPSTAPSATPSATPAKGAKTAASAHAAAPAASGSAASLVAGAAPSDETPDPVGDRKVAEAVFAGNYAKALEECGALAVAHPGSARYGVMVRVLRAKAARTSRN